ncbi:MAG: serine protease [Pedosphaera sp.]|nr:serine protease [Pedosphaera sp.]
MNRNFTLALFVTLTLAFAARADEVSEKGREIFKKHQSAVVTVQEVVKMTYSSAGRTAEPRENKQDLTGTVIDPSGLTVLALSAVDPSEMVKRMYPDYKMDIEVSDVKILLDDGAEIPAEIVLRDKDLDLAFIRPKAKQSTPMAAVDLTKSSTAQVLDSVITLNRLGRAAGRAHAASVERINAVVSKPRTFYIPDSMMTTTSAGSPAFALDGNIVGLMVMRAINSGGGASASRQDAATSIILPAEDILKAAKQAPEAKGDDEKKEIKPDAAKPEAAKPEPKKD